MACVDSVNRTLGANERAPRACHFDPSGGELGLLGDKTTNYGSFHELDAWIAIAPSGRIFASNTGGNLIKVFDASGRPLFVFGGHGDAPGRFLILAGVAVTNTRCYALDLSAGRILAFDLPSI